MIAMIDDAVGDVLRALDATNQRAETSLAFMSDHGDYLGDRRLLLKGASLYQSIVRTPFLWADPKSSARAVRSDALASTIDLAATVLERAGLAPYRGLEGVSQLPALHGGAPARENAFMQYDHQRGPSRPGRMLRTHGIVTKDWRVSIAEGIEGGELYDLRNDPDEFFNCWDGGSKLEDKCAMLERLARTEMESVDELPFPSAVA